MVLLGLAAATDGRPVTDFDIGALKKHVRFN
jgi:hypothetical protein